MKKRLATFIAAIILCAVLAITAGLVNLSATETKAETYRDPFAEYDKAIPLNLSCEDHGIRVTAVSALLTDLELKIRYDLQDLEGGRLDHNYINRNADDWFRYNMELSDPYVTGISTGMSSKGDPDSFTLYQSVLYSKINSEDTLSVRIPCIPATRNVSIPLLSLLEEYGQATEAASLPAPEHAAHVRPSDWPDIKKVLDYSHPLDIPLNDGQDQKKVLLTGIGWIDGQLHIQIHDPDNALMLGRSLSGSDSSEPVRLRYDISYPDTYPETGRIMWDDNNDDNRDWVEIIIGCRPEDLEKLNCSLNVTYMQEMLEGSWEFNIPLEEIRP